MNAHTGHTKPDGPETEKELFLMEVWSREGGVTRFIIPPERNSRVKIALPSGQDTHTHTGKGHVMSDWTHRSPLKTEYESTVSRRNKQRVRSYKVLRASAKHPTLYITEHTLTHTTELLISTHIRSTLALYWSL